MLGIRVICCFEYVYLREVAAVPPAGVSTECTRCARHRETRAESVPLPLDLYFISRRGRLSHSKGYLFINAQNLPLSHDASTACCILEYIVTYAHTRFMSYNKITTLSFIVKCAMNQGELDGYIVLRTIRLCFWICVLLFFPGILVTLPINICINICITPHTCTANLTCGICQRLYPDFRNIVRLSSVCSRDTINIFPDVISQYCTSILCVLPCVRGIPLIYFQMSFRIVYVVAVYVYIYIYIYIYI